MNLHSVPGLLTLLFLLFLAPACAPNDGVREDVANNKVVIISDSTKWETDGIRALRKQLEEADNRVLVTGEPGENGAAIITRLPWLLQPGVDMIYYDPTLAGAALADSLQAELVRMGHPAKVVIIEPRSTE